MKDKIFLIGPASVGKTTTGTLLAKKLNYNFVDIDKEFCNRIKLIPDYIREFSYAGYSEANSQLTDDLIKENSEQTVFATPSGYLTHEDSPHLVEKHLSVIKNGISILLLPSHDPIEGVDEIVRRQLARWDDVDSNTERERFMSRFDKYKNYGDIQVFSMDKPEAIIQIILKRLAEF